MSFVLASGVLILRRRSTSLFGRTSKGAQDCFVSPQAAPLTAHNRERNHGNLHLTCELHRPRNPQDQGFTEASGCLQRDGEKVRSDREGRILDTGSLRFVAVVEAPDDISMTALGLSTGALGNVRTQTLRAFTPADMKTILGKMVKS